MFDDRDRAREPCPLDRSCTADRRGGAARAPCRRAGANDGDRRRRLARQRRAKLALFHRRRVGALRAAGSDAAARGGRTKDHLPRVRTRIARRRTRDRRSEEHTSELQSLMRISYAVFCLEKKNRLTDSVVTSTTDTTNILC